MIIGPYLSAGCINDDSFSGLFAEVVVQVICNYHLLDEFGHGQTWFSSAAKPLPPFAVKYLTNRILNEPEDGRVAPLLALQVAKCLAEATIDGRSVSDYVKELCNVMVSDTRESFTCFWACANFKIKPDTLRGIVNIAALYTNTSAILDKLALEDLMVRLPSWLFGTIGDYAARYGDKNMVDMVVKHQINNLPWHGSKYQWNDMFRLARRGGNMDAVESLWFSCPKRPGHDARGCADWLTEHDIMYYTNSPYREVFEFLVEQKEMADLIQRCDVNLSTMLLVDCALEGWTEMAGHFLSLGADVDGRLYDEGYGPSIYNFVGKQKRPLIYACDLGSEELVDILLAYGANTTKPVLEVAARKGNLSIVRKLLKHSAEFGNAVLEAVQHGWGDVFQELYNHAAITNDEGHLQALVMAAIQQEHTVMLLILLQSHRSRLSSSLKVECMRSAHEQGLESMVQLLEGFEVVE